MHQNNLEQPNEHKVPDEIIAKASEPVKKMFVDLLEDDGFPLIELPDLIKHINRIRNELQHQYDEAINEGQRIRNNQSFMEIRFKLEENNFSGFNYNGSVPQRDDYSSGYFIGFASGGLLGAVIASGLELGGFMIGVGGLIIGWIGSMIGSSIDESSYHAQLLRFKEKILKSVENDEANLLKIDTDIADENDANTNIINRVIQRAQISKSNYNETMLEGAVDASNMAPLVQITAIADGATRGKPKIAWVTKLLSAIDSTVLNDAERQEALVALENIEAFDEEMNRGLPSKWKRTLRIYKNTGNLLTTDFEKNATLIYNKPFSRVGEYIDQSAPHNTTINYYAVTHITYMALEEIQNAQGAIEWSWEEQKREYLIESECITVPPFYNEEERTEHNIKMKTAKIKRKKFESKYSQIMSEMSGEEADPMDILKAELGEIEKKSKRIQWVNKQVEDTRPKLVEMGYEEDEIEEIIEELLMKLEV